MEELKTTELLFFALSKKSTIFKFPFFFKNNRLMWSQSKHKILFDVQVTFNNKKKPTGFKNG